MGQYFEIIKLMNKLQTMKRWHIDEEISKPSQMFTSPFDANVCLVKNVVLQRYFKEITPNIEIWKIYVIYDDDEK